MNNSCEETGRHFVIVLCCCYVFYQIVYLKGQLYTESFNIEKGAMKATQPGPLFGISEL